MLAHSFSVAFHLPPVQLHKGFFSLDFQLPQEPGAWFGGENSHQQSSGSLAGRGKESSHVLLPSEAPRFPGTRAGTEVSTLLGTWADISQG